MGIVALQVQCQRKSYTTTSWDGEVNRWGITGRKYTDSDRGARGEECNEQHGDTREDIKKGSAIICGKR